MDAGHGARHDFGHGYVQAAGHRGHRAGNGASDGAVM